MNTYRQHWDDDSFLAKLTLLHPAYKYVRQSIRLRGDVVSAYSALSSTCFSIAGTAAATLKKHVRSPRYWLYLPLDIFTWLPLGLWCYARMRAYSDQVVERAYDGYGTGYDNLTADQCDVRQSILRARRDWTEAEFCIDAALRKNPQGHTLGLLLIGKATCINLLANAQQRTVEQRQIAVQLEKIIPGVVEKDPRQAIRLYRGLAEIFSRIDGSDSPGAVDAKENARELAMEIGAKDQLAKL